MREQQSQNGGLGDKIVGAYKSIEGKFVDKFLEEDGTLKTGDMAQKAASAYQKIEDTVVGSYKKVEQTVVGGYKKVEDTFVDAFLKKSEDGRIASQGEAAEEDKE